MLYEGLGKCDRHGGNNKTRVDDALGYHEERIAPADMLAYVMRRKAEASWAK